MTSSDHSTVEQAVIDAVTETRISNARIAAALEDFGAYLKQQQARERSASSAVVRIDAGTVGVWMAITACVCAVVVSGLIAMWMMFEVADLRDTDKVHKAYIDQIRKEANSNERR